jgi:hypothetical protein
VDTSALVATWTSQIAVLSSTRQPARAVCLESAEGKRNSSDADLFCLKRMRVASVCGFMQNPFVPKDIGRGRVATATADGTSACNEAH